LIIIETGIIIITSNAVW